jgi:hypothetical protein
MCETVDWQGYHHKHCKDHDFCGAVQASGEGEDIHACLQAVDASLDLPVVAPPIQLSSDVPDHGKDNHHEVWILCCTSWKY